MTLRKNCVAVISSGNGGQALAAYYALHGYEVRLYAPSDPHTRYIYEDVPTGCMPMAALGRILNVPMPVTESVISWASTVCNTDFYAIGRNEKRLDLNTLLSKTVYTDSSAS